MRAFAGIALGAAGALVALLVNLDSTALVWPSGGYKRDR